MKIEETIECLNNMFDFNEFHELMPEVSIDTFCCIAGTIMMTRNTVLPEVKEAVIKQLDMSRGCCGGGKVR